MVQYKVDSVAGLVDAVRRAQPGDSLELDASALSGWRIGLYDRGWRLTDGQFSVLLDQDGGARFRIVIEGRAYLLVGENGRPSIQSAIDAAVGGETILVAPGTYGEGRTFDADELGATGLGTDTYGLVINKAVSIQGVSDSGEWISDCDDVAAAAVALCQSREGVSFLVTAGGASIRGLGFVPSGPAGDCAARACFAVHASGFGLHASVVERERGRGSARAVHFPRRRDAEPHRAVLTANVLNGSVTIDASGDLRPMDVTIVGNDIHGERLPPVLVTCDAGILSAPRVQPLLPRIEDNLLRVSGGVTLAFALGIHGMVDGDPRGSTDFDQYLRKVLDSHDGAGALVVDRDGHARLKPGADLDGGGDGVLVTGIHASIQAAIDLASHGDTVHLGAGVYQECLSLSGKALHLAGTTDAHGDPLVKLIAPEDVQGLHPKAETRRSVIIDLSGQSGARQSVKSVAVESVSTSGAPLTSTHAGATGEVLPDYRVLDLLNSTASRALPVRHFGRDGSHKGTHANVQQAIEAAVDGDRIEIAPGTFAGDLYITRPLTLLGANAGRPGHSIQRGLESVILGDVTIRCGAAEVVIDGLTIRGSVTSRVASGPHSHLALRCCVVDAAGLDTAITILGGSGTMLASNRIISGSEEGIFAPSGFDDLVISGNRIEIAEGAAGIVLHAGAGTDSAYILGNTAVGGDYGILVEGGTGLEGPGDSITIAGNCFGELRDGVASGAPAIAAICADRPISRALERSLGACLESNVYNLPSTSVPVDIAFESGSSPRNLGGAAEPRLAGKPGN